MQAAAELQPIYSSNDKFVTSIEPKVRSGRVWKSKKFDDAKRDLECESIQSMTQPHFRPGIGFGDLAKPWERTSHKEQKETAIGRVKENIEKETKVTMVYWRCRTAGMLGERQ